VRRARWWLIGVAVVTLVAAIALTTARGTARWTPRQDAIDATAALSAPSGTVTPPPPTGMAALPVPTRSASTPTAAPSGRAVLRPTATSNRPRRVEVSVAATRTDFSGSGGPPSSSPTPVDPIVGMRLSIKQQVDARRLNPAKAPELYKKVDEIAHAVSDDDADEGEKRVGDLGDNLIQLHENGNLTTAGYQELSTDVDRLAESLR
jgi:hypothetical protein